MYCWLSGLKVYRKVPYLGLGVGFPCGSKAARELDTRFQDSGPVDSNLGVVQLVLGLVFRGCGRMSSSMFRVLGS